MINMRYCTSCSKK